MRRKMPLLCGIILGGLLAILPSSGVEAAEQDLSVAVQTEVHLGIDRSDPANPVFSGSGDIYLTTEDAASHKFVAVALPEEFDMETPAGKKRAPEGTKVTYEGSMNARNGFENFKAINGLEGKTEDDIYMGKIRVTIPLTKDFTAYGAGSYSLSIPVTLTSQTAYGSYSSYETGLVFTPWDKLVASGGVTLSGTKIYRINQKDMILDIDPSVTEISGSFTYSTYKEVDVPSSVTSGYHVFQNSPVEKILFGEGTTTIPSDFCYYATSLKEVEMPDTVTTFKNNCFRNCTNLEKITFPSVMTLETTCFANCKKLEELHITNGVTTNASSAAYGPFVGSGIRKVIVEDGTTTVPKYICAGCTQIEELYLPDTLKTMGTQCFTGMSDLKEVTIRSDVTQDNIYSTVGCFENTGIEKITFADGVTKVTRYLFANGCSNVTEINLPDTLTEIDNDAFAGCTSLSSLEIPTSVKTLGADCFKNAVSLKELHIRADYALTRGYVISPFTNSGIEKLVIEEGVTTIPAHMFRDGCSQMTSLSLPTTLTTVGGSAFRNCKSLKDVTIKSNVELPYATVVSPFEGGDLESITYADGVTVVGSHFFDGACTSLTELNLPDTLLEIGSYAFSGCASLSELILPDSLTTLGGRCFKDAKALKRMDIRKNYILPSGTACSPFEGSGVETLVFHEGVTDITAHLFDDGCSNMTELILPSTIDTIGGYAFANCKALKSLKVNSNIRPPHATVVSPFKGGDIENIEITPGVTYLGDYLFSGACSSMTRLVLPEGMTVLGSNVFSGCSSLSELYIPKTMQEMGIHAFEDCVSLKVLNMNSSFRKTNGAAISSFENGGITEVNVANGVTEIKTNYLNNVDGAQIVIHIPASVTKIGYDVFKEGADYIVYYYGTQAEWSAVEKDTSFVPTKVVCSDTVAQMMIDMVAEEEADNETEDDTVTDNEDSLSPPVDDHGGIVDGKSNAVDEQMNEVSDEESVGESEEITSEEPMEETGENPVEEYSEATGLIADGEIAGEENLISGEDFVEDSSDDVAGSSDGEDLSEYEDVSESVETEVMTDDGSGERKDSGSLCEWSQDNSKAAEGCDDGVASTCGEGEPGSSESECQSIREAEHEVIAETEYGVDEYRSDGQEYPIL